METVRYGSTGSSENNAPEAPISISYTSNPKGGETITVTCSAASDVDGDPISYVWEVALDGVWSSLTTTTGTAITYTPRSGSTIAFRVRSYDGELYSDYTTGETYAIYFNQPPTVPASVHYDTPKAGKKLAIICAESADTENETIHYVWERSIDGGIYSQIGITYVNVFEDNVPTSGTTYRIRVKAADSSNNESDYRYGSLLSINYNQTPAISGADEDYGERTNPFSYDYTPSDPDAENVITVTEAVDGMEIRQFTAVSGKEYTADLSSVWLTLGSGSHRLIITVSDQDGESVNRVIRFSRTVNKIEVRRDMETPALVRKCFISIFPKIEVEDEETEVMAEVTNNPYDETPIWEGISDKLNDIIHVFKNTTLIGKPGIGYRIRLSSTKSTVYLHSVVCRYNIGQAVEIDESGL